MTKPKAVKNGVVCSSRLTWYRRENLPCLRLLRFANRGFVERVMETIWDLQVDRSGFKSLDFNSSELAYQLAADEAEIKLFLMDRRTVEALEQVKVFMEMEYLSGISFVTGSVTKANRDAEESEGQDGIAPSPNDRNPIPTPAKPTVQEGGWSDEGWSPIYLDARAVISSIWPKTTAGVVNDVRIWVGLLTDTEAKKVTKEQREEWVPRILEVLKADDETDKYTKFKDWMMKSGAVGRIKKLGVEGGEISTGLKWVERNSTGYAKRAKGFEDPDVREDAEEFERQKAIAEFTGIF